MAAALMLVLPAIAVTAPTTAFAQKPDNPECWGTVTSQAASSDGRAFGKHASDPTPGDDQPRQGIGNVAKSFGGHPSDLGTVLATIDGNPETQCP